MIYFKRRVQIRQEQDTVTQRDTEKFQRIFIQIIEQVLQGPNTVEAGVEEPYVREYDQHQTPKR